MNKSCWYIINKVPKQDSRTAFRRIGERGQLLKISKYQQPHDADQG